MKAIAAHYSLQEAKQNSHKSVEDIPALPSFQSELYQLSTPGMGSVNAKSSTFLPDKILPTSRLVTLLGSILVALGSGTGYAYSAYAPQIGARLRVSHTQLNVIGLAGNIGTSLSGPIWGRIVDRKGPQIPLIGAGFFLFIGYLGIKQMYDDGTGNGSTVSVLHLLLLVACAFMTGLGSHAGIIAAINATAKSFPSSTRATTTSLVLSGYGLSAFLFALLARVLFPGDTSALLLILAIGTATPMLIGLFIVKPIPLFSSSSGEQEASAIDGYNLVPSGDPQVTLGPQVETEDADSASCLSHDQEPDMYQVPVSPSAVELEPPASWHFKGSTGDVDALPDIHGKQLWLTPDFYLVFAILGICGGTGLMYINNVGSMAQALYAKTHANYDEIEAVKLQVAQVSILSLGNFAGRVLIGLVSDFMRTRLRLPRAYYFCIVSSLFIISQVAAIIVSSAETLWIATLLLGLAYGSLFGGSPAIMIEWFGLAHFSENSGYVSFSSVIGGNIFSLIFGHEVDTHAPAQDASSTLMMRTMSSFTSVPRGLPSEHQCFDGKACYLGSLRLTLVACIVSLGLSWWAGIRDRQRSSARNADTREHTELSLRV